MRRSSRLRGKRVNYNEAAMVTAYEKRAGAELTYKEKPKLYVKKPVYRPRLPKKPRQIPRYKPPPRPRQRAVQPRQRPSTSSSQPRVRYHTPARAATPTPRARIVQDEHEIDYPEEKQSVVRDTADNRLSRIYEMQAKKTTTTQENEQDHTKTPALVVYESGRNGHHELHSQLHAKPPTTRVGPPF